MKEIKIGCFGVNGHQIHGNAGQLKRARLTAFGGVDAKTFASMADKNQEIFAGVRHFVELDDLLRDSDVDLVSLCSARRDQQAGHAIACLNAGKHVIAEKPMATSRADLERLRAAVAAAAASGPRLWTMTSMVYYPAVKALKRVLDSGALGRLVQVHMMKSYPYHDRRPQDRGVDGGITQAAIHAFSVIGHVTGQDFDEIFAQDTDAGNPVKGRLQMAATLACRLSDGALASIVCNYCNQRSAGYWGNDQIRLHGTKGVIELVDGFSRRSLVLAGQPPASFEDEPAPPEYPQDMVDSILDGSPTLLSIDAGFRYTEAAVRAQESMDRGVPLRRAV